VSAPTSSERRGIEERLAGTPLERPARALATRRRRLRALRPYARPRALAAGTVLWARDRLHRRTYRHLAEHELLARRRSDTAFVFGSGRSLASLADDEWHRIEEHDTVGFSEFQRQRKVRVDFHIVGEVYDVDEYAALFREHPGYADTVYVLQEGLLAARSNELVARRLLPPSAAVFRYRRTSRGVFAPPSRRFADGLVHAFNSSIGATNFALLLGHRRIVVTGVDLFNREYFWLEPGQARPNEESDEAARLEFRGADAVVDTFGRWRELLEPEGVELLVYSPESRLADVLPVFSWERA
jgi:hypothetical protein